MVTTATDNVVHLSESRSSIGYQGHSRTSRDARDLVAQKLRELVRAFVDQFQEELARKGDVADEREQRNFFYGGRELIQENVGRLEGLIAGHWLKLFDGRAAGRESGAASGSMSSLDDLQLVDLGDMDEQLAVKGLASQLQDACEEGLFAASRRLAFLHGNEESPLPLEGMFAEVFQTALKELSFPASLRLEILQGLGRKGADLLGPVIHDLNAFLVGRRVLPSLKRSYTRAKRAEAGDADKQSAAAADVFALLQRLVPGAEAGAMAGGIAPGGGQAGPGIPIGGGQGGVPMTSEAMAAAMQRVMVSLDTLQHLPPVPLAMPTTNVLREFRGSDIGLGLDHLDAVTVDIVATLFDFIFDDASVSDPMKALIGRLQIPVLKVAMLDKSFFSSKQHPARRLLDSLSRAAASCGAEAGHENPLYAHVSSIVDRVLSEFRQDAKLFDILCVELDDFLIQQESEAEARAIKAAPLVAQQERRELAAVAADGELRSWFASPLPEAIADLLGKEWRSLLVRRYLEDDAAGWALAVGTADELVNSIRPIDDAAGRKALAGKLPSLVKRIHDALDQAGVTMERRVALLDCLFSLHAAVLRGAIAPAMEVHTKKEPGTTEPAIVSESVEVDGAVVQSLSLVDSDNVPVLEGDSDAQQRVDELQRGDWVEFPGGESGPVRYRLSWVSPERGILLFTNPRSPRALSVAPAALARQLEKGEAMIVPVEPIFDRAVHRALETLKAA